MSLTLSTAEGPLKVSLPLLQAIVRNAHRRADLVGVTLNEMGIFKSPPCRLPAAFLLELSAVIELRLWELQGLRAFLDSDLPTYCEAASALCCRAAKGSEEFAGPDAAPLSLRVLKVWIERFSWEGPQLLGCDVLLHSANDEDEFVAMLAEFVWKHRHDFEHLAQRRSDGLPGKNGRTSPLVSPR